MTAVEDGVVTIAVVGTDSLGDHITSTVTLVMNNDSDGGRA